MGRGAINIMNKQLIKQVAKVVGKKLAVHELSIVDAAHNIIQNDEAKTILSAFAWSDTPQGSDFWHSINRGDWPYNYTRGES